MRQESKEGDRPLKSSRQDRSQESEVHLDTFEQMLAAKLTEKNRRMALGRRAAFNRTKL